MKKVGIVAIIILLMIAWSMHVFVMYMCRQMIIGLLVMWAI